MDWTPIVLSVMGIISCIWYLIWGQFLKRTHTPRANKYPIDSLAAARSAMRDYIALDREMMGEWEERFKAATAWDNLAKMAKEGPPKALGPGAEYTFSKYLQSAMSVGIIPGMPPPGPVAMQPGAMNLRGYRCALCGAEFIDEWNLDSHRQWHHGYPSGDAWARRMREYEKTGPYSSGYTGLSTDPFMGYAGPLSSLEFSKAYRQGRRISGSAGRR